MMDGEIKKRALICGLAAVLLATIVGTLSFSLEGNLPIFQSPAAPVAISSSSLLTTFSSQEALKDFLASHSTVKGPFPFYGPMDIGILNAKFGLSINSALGPERSTFEYSSTNIQVAGVDEADNVKTDGEYIYALSGSVVSILKAYPPQEAKILSSITLDDLDPVGIFVNGNNLAVLGSKYVTSPMPYFAATSFDVKTFLRVYDIRDRSDPILLRDLALTGSYFNSRMIGKYVYFVVGQPAYLLYDAVVLPKIYSNGLVREVAPSDVHYCNGSDDYYQFTTFVAVNIQNLAEAPKYLTIMLGGTSGLYVSMKNMYVTFRDNGYGNTTVYRVRVEADSMTVEAKGSVPGNVLNQFAMDEHDDYFRIATTTWRNAGTNVYVLDMNLSITGRLENLATGENFHSSRFIGDRCYLVTFKKTDPLFVIDLANASSPTVLGELKIPGYSDYLHPYDETHLIGVGKETVEAEQGYFAWYQGVKISLFDVSNVTNPKQMANYIIGDRGSDTPILRDHRAFLFDRTRNLLVIPVLVAEVNENQYPYGVPPYVSGEQVWQGAYVFNVTLEQGFAFRGGITHLSNGAYIGNDSYWVERSLYIEHVLYTVSEKKIKMNSLVNLALIGQIELP